jgi:hypothetical protein
MCKAVWKKMRPSFIVRLGSVTEQIIAGLCLSKALGIVNLSSMKWWRPTMG